MDDQDFINRVVAKAVFNILEEYDLIPEAGDISNELSVSNFLHPRDLEHLVPDLMGQIREVVQENKRQRDRCVAAARSMADGLDGGSAEGQGGDHLIRVDHVADGWDWSCEYHDLWGNFAAVER